MPIYYWNKYRDSLKGKYLIKEVRKASNIQVFFNALFYGIIRPKKYNKDFYSETWNKLYQQFIDKFGFDDSFKELLRLKKERFDIAIEFSSKHIDKRDRFLITKYKVLTRQIEDLEKGNGGEKLDFEAVKVYVDKWLNTVLNDKECSVIQYQYYITQMRNERSSNNVSTDNGGN